MIVMALALVVPIVANGFRAFGIVMLGHFLGSAEAAAADHVVYGWVFFSIVMLLLIVAGLPFREDGEPEPRPAPPAEAGRPPRLAALAASAVLALGLGAAAPAASMALQQAGARPPERIAVPLQSLEGCEPAPDGARLLCGDLLVRAEAVVFPARATWNVVSAERARAAGLDDQDIQFRVRLADAGSWNVRQSRERSQTVAVGLWLNGQPAGGGVRSRAEQAWNSLGGGSGLPVLVAVTIQPARSEGAVLNALRQRALLEAVLEAQARHIGTGAATLSKGNRARTANELWPAAARSRG
jgi:hypothetical protein